MLRSSEVELAIYRYVTKVGRVRPAGIGELSVAVEASAEEVVERLVYLHSAGHVALWKHEYSPGRPKVPYSEESKAFPAGQVDFFYRGSFEIEITPSGRKYFENLDRESNFRRVSARAARRKAAAVRRSSSTPHFETAFHTYNQERVIAEGGAGTVFEVRDEEGRFWALKRLDPSKTTSQKRKRFIAEIEFCKRQNHKNIVKVADEGFQMSDGAKSPFYVMPLYPATLRHLIIRQMDPKQALHYFRQVLDGVEVAHLHKVWHRDLKPENILCDTKGEIAIIADFGIAHFEEEALYTAAETRTGERLANFLYAAPEQRSRGRTVDSRADIYALGLILNEMFTQHVLQGSGYAKIESTAPEYAFLDEIVEMMVRQLPEERPESIDAVKRLLIAKGDEFVSRQRISSLEGAVVSESAIEDPLVLDPVRLVKVDYRRGVLEFTLSTVPTTRWIDVFQSSQSTSFVIGKAPGHYRFEGNKARIAANPHQGLLQNLTDHFKAYVESANESYSRQVTEERLKQIKQDRERLRAEAEEERLRLHITRNIKI